MKILRIILLPLYIIAVITKRFKRQPHKKQRYNKLPFEVDFVIDSKNKTLQEIQEERKIMKRILLQGI